ncbi:phosphatidate cytidylyltransferase [Candidatus Uabimicrobium sp. HlEnr_7]|uniref:phosphatidate cytidylyltransferase n=1 Tax=Candidatus Uabimicrobium helgolandensis TaxID=3095367 RepID=UPI0035565744
MVLKFYLFFHCFLLIWSPFYFFSQKKSINKWFTMVVLVHLLCLSLLWNFHSFVAWLLFLAVPSLYEQAKLMNINFKWTLLCAAMTVLLLLRYEIFAVLFLLPFICVVFIAFFMEATSKIYSYSFAIFFIVYGAMSLFFITKHQGIEMIIVLYLVVSFNDIFAHTLGKAIGGKKPFPEISPNKTISGYISGVVGVSVAAAALYFYIPILSKYSQMQVLVLTAMLYLTANVGDLVVSALKRKLEVKDFGSFLPGHGGMLDRCDNIFFTGPFLYIFKTYFI